ncbi:MAG TPA: ethanolamine ammonia-lyase reactivating factor EutA [Chloroflexota bacterium]|jgi:ethanolamine utilization protein EutA|nr:ethanolamine ammonia-lyase reactivating factor EutA [Chloroflexota bacterium]
MAEEDRIVLTSVGVDIGSSTSHLLFSRLELERQDNRYVTVTRDVLYQSDILLTPYTGATTIDGAALGAFIERQYLAAGLQRAQVDTGALILTGVALLRDNARAIADLFAGEAGRFVAVSAGDNLEATMAAHGSGAVTLSQSRGTVMNVDIGGGTTKVVICRDGQTSELMAIDIGARLVACDAEGRVTRLEPAGRDIAQRLGISLQLGQPVSSEDLQRIAAYMVDELFGEISVGDAASARHSQLLRTPPLSDRRGINALTFSGGVSEYIYGTASQTFGDLGPLIAHEINCRQSELGAPIELSVGRIRATVIGASQYTIQVSGSTIYLSPLDVVPIRNVPVIMPHFPWQADEFDAETIRQAIHDALRRFDLLDARGPVALAAQWEGSATYGRIKAFCAGALQAMQAHLDNGQPLILVFDSDIGGLLGLHVREELRLSLPIVSIDGVDLREFDFIDIGEFIPTSGAVPVVIKSLVFPPAQH